VITTVNSISSLDSNKIQTSDKYFTLKQFDRTYSGGYNINFVRCLSAINSAKTKNYTNFYLTNDYKYSDIIIQGDEKIKFPYIHGPLIYGSTFLKFVDIDPRPYAKVRRYTEAENYGIGVFVDNYDEFCDFTIILKSKNRCYLYYTKDYKKYYLCSDIDNQLIFVKENLLLFDDNNIGPQDFDYVYSEDLDYMFFYKKTPSGNYSVVNFDNTLKLNSLIDGDLISNTKSPFKLFKNIYDENQKIPNNSFITYTGENNIDIYKSELDLSNNLLLYKQFMDYDTDIDIIVLKNNLLETGIFSSANNLLSGAESGIYVDGLREYTNILNDINEETSDSLELNYIFYNTSYIIKKGDNIFISPSSMYPFSKLNINDTKFVENGSFAYITPEYSDKIYHLSDNINLHSNNQHLLCTWLSGSHQSNHKIWVDRYYYPDLIDKQNALSGIPELSQTYDDYIESLIYYNTDILDSCTNRKFFDKKSDLVFEPNQKYIYSRTDYTNSNILSSFTDKSIINDINYFRKINESGELSIGFSFFGDDSNWEIKSDRNDINSGLSFSKKGYELTISYDVYDSTDFAYDFTEYSWIRNSKTITLEPLKSNFVSVGISTKTKTSYFFVNNFIVHTFNLPTYQLYIKQLLYGDFHIYNDNKKIPLDNNSGITSNVFIMDTHTPIDLINIYNLAINVSKVNDIYISLPGGMVNGLDTIELLNSICGASTFKSNFIDINIKNLNISNSTVLSGLSDTIKTNLVNILPTNSTINNIDFKNYK
jgi:hypothetical protein